MKRIILHDLREWAALPSDRRKPLIVRGARQVGKTWAIRALSHQFASCVEVNFEFEPQYAHLFERDLNPRRIVDAISAAKGQKIVPGETLLFFDEIQEAPSAIRALRYFYEVMPDLHLIAAGSLIEFVLQHTGMPVGRVDSLHLYPLSFAEFLAASGKEHLLFELLNHQPGHRFPLPIHSQCLEQFGEYLFTGGMPEVVGLWIKERDRRGCRLIQQQLITGYRSDFHKYARKGQYKYLDLLFDAIPASIGKKFVFSKMGEGVRKRDVSPCVDLLVLAGVLHQVVQTSAHSPPLAAAAKVDRYKLIMNDVGLLGAIARHPLDTEWSQGWNKGDVAESVVGQESVAYGNPRMEPRLFYWHREERAAAAEVDYLIERGDSVLPIEVKGGDGRSLRSLKNYIKETTLTGYRLSIENREDGESIKNLPIYAVCSLFQDELNRKLSDIR